MRTVQVSELKDRLDEVIEAVRNGETVEIWDGPSCFAHIVPKTPVRRSATASRSHAADVTSDETALDAHLDDGKTWQGTEPFPTDFFTRPLPKAHASVLEQLLEDRRNGR